MIKKTFFLFSIFLSMTMAGHVHARSTNAMTAGIMGMGNIQILESLPELDPGPGGGAYFDYRFNQRFSLTVEAWATTHGGADRSDGDEGIELLGIPTFTLRMYLLSDEMSKWDPYLGIGIGAYATSEGTIENGTNGVGLGAQIDVGFDYYFSDVFSAGFAGVFRSAGIVTSLRNNANNATAVIPFSLVARFGYHF